MEAQDHQSSPSPAPAYTVRPRWSHDDDQHVTVAQSTLEYTQHVFKTKPESARWVRGLAEGEESYPTGAFRRRGNLHKWEELDDTPEDGTTDGTGTSNTKRRPWLFLPNVLGIAYMCLLLLRVSYGLHKSYRLDYPTNERQIELYGRRYGENPLSFIQRVVLPLSLPHAVGAAYTLILSYQIGVAAHDFVALWGVGLSILSLIALFLQGSLLFSSCTTSFVSHRWECEIPYTLHYVCSAIRVLCPLLALWCVAPVLDRVRHCGWRWRCVLALPCFVSFGSLASWLYTEEQPEMWLDVSHATVLLVWSFFIQFCWKQPRFVLRVPPVEKPHED